MRHEPAAVARDRRAVLANADTVRLAADEPTADHRIMAIHARQLGPCLIPHRTGRIGSDGSDPGRSRSTPPDPRTAWRSQHRRTVQARETPAANSDAPEAAAKAAPECPWTTAASARPAPATWSRPVPDDRRANSPLGFTGVIVWVQEKPIYPRFCAAFNSVEMPGGRAKGSRIVLGGSIGVVDRLSSAYMAVAGLNSQSDPADSPSDKGRLAVRSGYILDWSKQRRLPDTR